MKVVVVGGGASGVLVAAQVLRASRGSADVVVVEPRSELGAGIAYSTSNPSHLLNVRADRMSALPDEPDHFRAWARCDPQDYVPRAWYARYLRDVLAASPGAITHRRTLVTGVTRLAGDSSGYRVTFLDGGTEHVDAVIVATGNAAPALPSGITVDPAVESLISPDPWSGQVDLAAEARVAVLGSGLSAVDVALTVLGDRSDTSLTLISRHGRLPQPHATARPEPLPPVVTVADLHGGMSLSQATLRMASTGANWRGAFDGIRPVTQALWQSLSEMQREQFQRHLLGLWDVHRHRMAPEVARRIADWRQEGRLHVVAGEVREVASQGSGLRVVGRAGFTLNADRLVLATGPASGAAANPLLANLVNSGDARPGPLGWGIDLDVDSLRVLNARGEVHPWLFVVGPPTRGVLFESTSMPDIRGQAATIGAAFAS